MFENIIIFYFANKSIKISYQYKCIKCNHFLIGWKFKSLIRTYSFIIHRQLFVLFVFETALFVRKDEMTIKKLHISNCFASYTCFSVENASIFDQLHIKLFVCILKLILDHRTVFVQTMIINGSRCETIDYQHKNC